MQFLKKEELDKKFGEISGTTIQRDLAISKIKSNFGFYFYARVIDVTSSFIRVGPISKSSNSEEYAGAISYYSHHPQSNEIFSLKEGDILRMEVRHFDSSRDGYYYEQYTLESFKKSNYQGLIQVQLTLCHCKSSNASSVYDIYIDGSYSEEAANGKKWTYTFNGKKGEKRKIKLVQTKGYFITPTVCEDTITLDSDKEVTWCYPWN